MGDTVKVSVLELNGEEYDTPTERILQAKDARFSASGFLADEAEAAIVEAKGAAISLPRFPIICVMNGTVSNNDWLAYSNLTPDASIVIPTKCELREVTWSNSSSNRSFDFVFYKNGRGTTPYATRSVRNSAAAYGAFSGLADAFSAGDTLDVRYADQGLNLNDAAIVFFFQTVE